MRDTELYRILLGVSLPWSVSRVEVSEKDQKVDVWVEHATGIKWSCPACSRELGVYDHSEERAWRHLDSCHFRTFLHARAPRVECPEHGVKQVKLPWAEPHSRFTEFFEALSIRVLLECHIEGAGRILKASWDECWHLLERATKRGTARKEQRVIPYLGVDEKAIAKGHTYLTLICDLDRGVIESVEKDRRKSSLERYYEGLTDEQKKGIKAVAMDMWHPYINATRDHIPGADRKIVIDRFHLMTHMMRALDSIRRSENAQLRKEGDETLKRTRHLWLFARENLPESSRPRFEDLKKRDLKTSRAWAIKENLRELWRCSTQEEARAHWKKWFRWATHSALKPVQKVAHIIGRHIENVMTYYRHRITTAACEGLNSKIQTIKKMACGFRSWHNFKASILFHCGGLDLYPGTHGNPG